MVLRNPLNYISQFFKKINNQLKKIYLNSNYYDKKISKINSKDLIYKPSPHILSSLIKYQKKKFNIDNFLTDNLWNNKNIDNKDFRKLNNFYWFFSLDLKSSKKITQSIISNWIKNNFSYTHQSWEFDLTSKRIIAWLSNHNLTCEESNIDYQNLFNKMIKKQANHLMNEINKSELVDDKIIGCAAIILVGLCFKDEKNYLSFGLNLLKKIQKSSLDNTGFPKSRSIKQLVFYLKYFIIIREWFKEAQYPIPDQVNETIYYLGQGYAFVWENIKLDILFNGNNNSNNSEFDNYLKRFGYKFKNENKEFGGYVVLQNKKLSLIMDVGPTPITKFTNNYQSGALSFEIISNGKKLISNCGIYENKNLKLNKYSRSTATHCTLIIDDHSSCQFERVNKSKFLVNDGLKIIKKKIVFEKNYWKINASHNGYLKRYNSIHEREVEFYPEQFKFVGTDKILNKKKNYNLKFEIRFHLEPGIKLMKTQDNKTILIELNDEGWRFNCDDFDINIDNGLYFGNKNSYVQNQNIFISGISNNQNENIKWQLTKI
tara:strand:+ start:946 stop:2577 length:1632 start_codon:yes stop_codon:yes gene_type:complete